MEATVSPGAWGWRSGRPSPCHARWSLIHHQAVHPQLQTRARPLCLPYFCAPSVFQRTGPGPPLALEFGAACPVATATSPHGERQEKEHCSSQEGEAKRMAGGGTGDPSGRAESPESSEGTLGRQGGQAAGCQWPQAYKSKRGASAGRGTTGRVGEAGPFLLGKSRRARVSGRGRVAGGSLGECAAQTGWDSEKLTSLRSVDTVVHLAEKCKSPLGAPGPGPQGLWTGYGALCRAEDAVVCSAFTGMTTPRRQGEGAV